MQATTLSGVAARLHGELQHIHKHENVKYCKAAFCSTSSWIFFWFDAETKGGSLGQWQRTDVTMDNRKADNKRKHELTSPFTSAFLSVWTKASLSLGGLVWTSGIVTSLAKSTQSLSSPYTDIYASYHWDKIKAISKTHAVPDISAGAGKFLGVRRIFAQICPKKNPKTKTPPQKNDCVSFHVGPFFSNQSTLSTKFAQIVPKLAHISRNLPENT